MKEKMYTVAEVAEMEGLSENGIRQWLIVVKKHYRKWFYFSKIARWKNDKEN